MNSTFPKGSKHPSASVGEQEQKSGVASWKGNASNTSYPGQGYKGTSFDGHKNKTLMLNQSGKFPGNPSKTSYPAAAPKSFGCEKPANSLKAC